MVKLEYTDLIRVGGAGVETCHIHPRIHLSGLGRNVRINTESSCHREWEYLYMFCARSPSVLELFQSKFIRFTLTSQ